MITSELLIEFFSVISFNIYRSSNRDNKRIVRCGLFFSRNVQAKIYMKNLRHFDGSIKFID